VTRRVLSGTHPLTRHGHSPRASSDRYGRKWSSGLTVKPDRERVRGLLRPDHPPEEHVLNRGLAMPLYDYQCKDCSELFEVRATIKEKEAGLALACPMCGSQETRQRLTYASVLHGGKSASLPTLSRPACGPNAGSGCCG